MINNMRRMGRVGGMKKMKMRGMRGMRRRARTNARTHERSRRTTDRPASTV